ncbi:hypothetical protein TA3x_001513 [Tundrisphaera sp. TA3]|uniref:hypothetical protein n=1 Tax=Tundrisphaera sp. TA3 TaxID=3435775 RepID=UPI003EBE48AB
MPKRITLRALMIAVAVCAACIVPFRIYRQYRADRVQFQALIYTHKTAEMMKQYSAKVAEIMEEFAASERDIARRFAATSAQPAGDESGRTDGSPATEEWDSAVRSIGDLARPEPPPIFDLARHRNDLADWTRKEAEARAAIEHWKATHFWF